MSSSNTAIPKFARAGNRKAPEIEWKAASHPPAASAIRSPPRLKAGGFSKKRQGSGLRFLSERPETTRSGRTTLAIRIGVAFHGTNTIPKATKSGRRQCLRPVPIAATIVQVAEAMRRRADPGENVMKQAGEPARFHSADAVLPGDQDQTPARPDFSRRSKQVQMGRLRRGC